jgi:hypothetical protein
MFVCKHCQREFSRNFCLSRHLVRNRCKALKTDVSTHILKLEKEIELLKEETHRELHTLRENPPTAGNQCLQVICVSNNDDYLDMLTNRLGTFGKAIEYLTDCALSEMTGDCRLIERIYMAEGQECIAYVDKARKQISYYNEKMEKVIDKRENFGKKIANNLQNGYLKGVNYLINRTLDEKLPPCQLLEDYDLQAWHAHIYCLSDKKYQKKFLKQLKIPFEDELRQRREQQLLGWHGHVVIQETGT